MKATHNVVIIISPDPNVRITIINKIGKMVILQSPVTIENVIGEIGIDIESLPIIFGTMDFLALRFSNRNRKNFLRVVDERLVPTQVVVTPQTELYGKIFYFNSIIRQKLHHELLMHFIQVHHMHNQYSNILSIIVCTVVMNSISIMSDCDIHIYIIAYIRLLYFYPEVHGMRPVSLLIEIQKLYI